MSGCDAKEYAFDLPEVAEVEVILTFLDQCGIPEHASLLERLRIFYLRGEHVGELPHVRDSREESFVEGWTQAIARVIELHAPTAEDPTGRNKDPIRRELLKDTSRAQALAAFQRWAKAVGA